MYMTSTKAYQYCLEHINSDRVGQYIKKQMQVFMSISEGKDPEYTINLESLELIELLLKELNMPPADEMDITYGKSIYECLQGFEWFFITAIFCVVYKDRPKLRRYKIAILEAARKNGKTLLTAIVCLLEFLIFLPPNSKGYTVSEDLDHAELILRMIEDILCATPSIQKLSGNKERFKFTQRQISYPKFNMMLKLLAYNNQKAVKKRGKDGFEPRFWVADEVGAFNDDYVYSALRLGQMNQPNTIGIILSTKYPTINNPFEKEVKLAKENLDGAISTPEVFALLYEPDPEIREKWNTSDLVLYQANPLASAHPDLFKSRQSERARAAVDPMVEAEFLTKVCNIVSTAGADEYISATKLEQCMVPKINWEGREVYIGLDLSMSDDNTAVAIIDADISEGIVATVYAFVPGGQVKRKETVEHVNYTELIDAGQVISCGGLVIDYGFIVDFIYDWTIKNDVIVKGVSIDPFNSDRVMNQLDALGFDINLTRQHSSILHAPSKLLREYVLTGKMVCERNELLLINCQNAKCTLDTNLNFYVNKKRSTGKVDLIVALINAVYLAQQEQLNPTQNVFVNTFIAE